MKKKNKLCYHFFQGLNHATEWLIYKTMESVHMAIMRWNCFFVLCWMVCVGSMRAIECISWSSDLAKELAIAAKRKQIKLFESELNCWISEFVECSLILSTLPGWMMNESLSVTIKLKHQLQMFTRLRNLINIVFDYSLKFKVWLQIKDWWCIKYDLQFLFSY